MWKLRQHESKHSSYSSDSKSEPKKNHGPKNGPWVDKPQSNWGLTLSKGQCSRGWDHFSLQTHRGISCSFPSACSHKEGCLHEIWLLGPKSKDPEGGGVWKRDLHQVVLSSCCTYNLLNWPPLDSQGEWLARIISPVSQEEEITCEAKLWPALPRKLILQNKVSSPHECKTC